MQVFFFKRRLNNFRETNNSDFRFFNFKKHQNVEAVRIQASLAAKRTRKSLTRGPTDRFVTYLQFSIKVCFSTTETEVLFPISLSVISLMHIDLKIG